METGSKAQVWMKVLRWLARVWSIPAILFIGAEIVSPHTNNGVEVFWYEWLAVGTLFISVLALLLGWWKERIGGWTALAFLVLSMIIYGIYTQELFPIEGLLMLLAGIAVPAVLFLVSDRMHSQAVS